MLGHGDPRHVVLGGQGYQSLAVALEEASSSARRVGSASAGNTASINPQ